MRSACTGPRSAPLRHTSGCGGCSPACVEDGARCVDTISSFTSSLAACPFGASIAAGNHRDGSSTDRDSRTHRIDQCGRTFSAHVGHKASEFILTEQLAWQVHNQERPPRLARRKSHRQHAVPQFVLALRFRHDNLSQLLQVPDVRPIQLFQQRSWFPLRPNGGWLNGHQGCATRRKNQQPHAGVWSNRSAWMHRAATCPAPKRRPTALRTIPQPPGILRSRQLVSSRVGNPRRRDFPIHGHGPFCASSRAGARGPLPCEPDGSGS